MLPIERIDAEAFARWGELKGAPLAMCRGFARAIEAEASAQDTALIRQLVSEIDGMRLAAGYDTYGRPNWDDLEPALKAARSRLLDSDLSKLTDRGAKAWAGVDAQKLREGEVP